jgi:hypothetical protein
MKLTPCRGRGTPNERRHVGDEDVFLARRPREDRGRTARTGNDDGREVVDGVVNPTRLGAEIPWIPRADARK